MTDRTDSRLAPRTTRRRVLILAVVLLAVLMVMIPRRAERSRRAEVNRLAELLSLREGMTVAEVGAGSGWLTVEVAQRVGSSGRVYSTELTAPRLDDIRHAAREAGLSNVTVLQAGDRTTNLSASCCDAIFMRRVYHHLSDPPAVTASLREALKPGGRLAIIEFRHDGILGRVFRMGIERVALVEAVTAAGFDVVMTGQWPAWDHYVALFEKPAAPAFVRLAEGFTSNGREVAINVKPRMFSAPTFADICARLEVPARLVVVTPTPLRLVTGQWFAYSQLMIVAVDASGGVLPAVPVAVEVEKTTPAILDLHSQIIGGPNGGVLPGREG